LSSLLFLWETGAKGDDAGRVSTPDEAPAAVKDCMVRNPAPWPDAWRQEYLDTIRKAISSDPNASHFLRRLEILREGFALYWPDLKNTQERSHFEVRRAQIRWYVENLMTAGLPGEEETALLRHQYEDLANHAAEGLITQFSFLDPNAVQRAKADYLAECYRYIDAPLLPIFLTPFSEGQIDQIKSRWHDLRHARVDLWQQGEGGRASSAKGGSPSAQHELDSLLAQRSMAQLHPNVWAVVASSPDDYRAAIARESDRQKQHFDARSKARLQESHLSNAVLQAEYLGFLWIVLLETAQEEFSQATSSQAAAQEK
jgi:hypothetical protein